MSSALQHGAHASKVSSSIVTNLTGVCFGMGHKEKRQPGLADALTIHSLGAILVRRVSKCQRLAACPRGSSANRVTTRAPKTTVAVTQSTSKNPDSPNGVCLGHGSVVDRSESTLVFAAPPSAAFRTGLSPHRHVQVQNADDRKKTGALNTLTGREDVSPSAIATAGRRLRGANGDGAASLIRLQSEREECVEKGLISFE